jgi:hypothetical protein
MKKKKETEMAVVEVGDLNWGSSEIEAKEDAIGKVSGSA